MNKRINALFPDLLIAFKTKTGTGGGANNPFNIAWNYKLVPNVTILCVEKIHILAVDFKNTFHLAIPTSFILE